MVWAAISKAGSSELLMTRRDLGAKKQGFKSRSYLQVFKDGLLPIILENDINQQDGARIHTSKAAKAWFKRNHIRLLANWPPYSPDLNPIEYLGLYSKKSYTSYIQILNFGEVARHGWQSVWKMP